MSAIYCEVCHVTLNGPAPSDQHFNSVKHRKKEAALGRAIVTTSRSFCKTCLIFCDTPQILAHHKQSPRHKNTKRKAKLRPPTYAKKLSRIPTFTGRVKKTRGKRSVCISTLLARLRGRGLPPADVPSGDDSDSSDSSEENPFSDTFPFYCTICKVPFNTKKDEEAHLAGHKHVATVTKSELVPEKQLPPITKSLPLEVTDRRDFDLTKTVPRSYQVELYQQAMLQDTVCFLPTGTGKTLVAVMVISKMLQLNPQHSVVFLVDKVLLVLQQYNVLRMEIGNKLFHRYDMETSYWDKRVPRIAALCSGKQDSGGLPLWKQDVIVATAAYYDNLLQKGLVRWEDHSLVVMDEAHHCDKGHPYHCLMQDYHIRLPTEARPKVMGLTASPAGKDSLVATVNMMRKLLLNMGQVTLIKVRKHQEELARYQSNTKLFIHNLSRSTEEEEMKENLRKYICRCYLELTHFTNIVELLRKKGIMDEGHSVENVKGYLWTPTDADEISAVLEALGQVNMNLSEYDTSSLVNHTKHICGTFLTLHELGLDCAREELLSIAKERSYQIEMQGLPIRELQAKISSKNTLHAQNLDANIIPIVQHIVNEILSINWYASANNQFGNRPLVLVLVKERNHARMLSDLLRRCKALVNLDIKSVCVVGHGTSAAKGMTVKKQERAIELIKKHVYQVIVATSVAEEGLDLPECELVVQLDPPKSVKALVQIRGRARKRGSRFVAICREASQLQSLRSLIERETFMIGAVNEITKDFNSVDIYTQCAAPWDYAGCTIAPATSCMYSDLIDHDIDERISPETWPELYCAVCSMSFNTDKDLAAHLAGQKHLAEVAKADTAPLRQLSPIVKSLPKSQMHVHRRYLDLTKTVPRSYQAELYQKAMMQDTVCFLPTGTGKTLVAVMVISKMLQLNPQRPVLFLVDKVLLVLQQCGVLRTEIGDKMYCRYDVQRSYVARRVPRIAALCGNKQDSGGLPLWQQDVIVATADIGNLDRHNEDTSTSELQAHCRL